MKVPIGENELGIVRYEDKRTAYFCRNGHPIYENECNNSRKITWAEFKSIYPYCNYHIFWRSKIKN